MDATTQIKCQKGPPAQAMRRRGTVHHDHATHLRAGNAHRNTDVSGFQSGRVVDAITSHRDDAVIALQQLDQRLLVGRLRTGRAYRRPNKWQQASVHKQRAHVHTHSPRHEAPWGVKVASGLWKSFVHRNTHTRKMVIYFNDIVTRKQTPATGARAQDTHKPNGARHTVRRHGH